MIKKYITKIVKEIIERDQKMIIEDMVNKKIRIHIYGQVDRQLKSLLSESFIIDNIVENINRKQLKK